MASLFVENFEGGTGGATATTSNTAFTAVSGTGAAFTAAPTPLPEGLLAVQVAAAAGTAVYLESTYTPTALFFRRVYVRPVSPVSNTHDLIALRGSNTGRSRLRLNGNGTVSLINGSTNEWTSSTVLPVDQWSRVEYRVDNTAGAQQARLYVGPDPHTTTVTEDSGDRAYNQGTIDTARLGQNNTNTTADVTLLFDAVADDDSAWPGPVVTSTPTVNASLTPTVTLTAVVSSATTTVAVSFAATVTLTASVAQVAVVLPPPPTMHTWAVWARDTDYAPSKALLIDTVQIVRKHMGVDTAVITTPFSPEAWAACAPSNGVIVHRDGRQEFSGPIAARQLNWDAETDPRPLITLECVGDEQHLADRLVMPDRLRAGDDQTVNDYWSFAGVASTAMWQMISDQAGPTARADRQVSGLVMGADPGVGSSRTWRQLFSAAGPNGVMDALAVISAASGLDLGIRVTSAAGQLTVDVVQPRDLTDGVKFAADMRNLVAIFYRETAPTVTHALSAGAGTLHTRVRKLVVTTSSLALAWGRQIWSYIDRSDTSDTTELAQADQDAIDQGPATVSLTVRLTDTEAATYGKDWDLGDKVTVYVGLPGQTQVAAVSDVVRQIALSVDNTGKESVQPAIGSYDATAIRKTPTQQQLAAAATGLAGLISRK